MENDGIDLDQKDITKCGDQELRLRVFDNQYFYAERWNRPFLMALIQMGYTEEIDYRFPKEDFKDLMALIQEQFKYTDKQLEILVNDLEARIELIITHLNSVKEAIPIEDKNENRK